MRCSPLRAASRPNVARAALPLFLACLVAIVAMVPEAEARRKRKRLPAYNPPYASMVYDVKSGRTLQATNPDALRHPASVTKVMTLYMLFEQLESGRFKLSSELPVSREAASQAPSKLGLRPGDTITAEDAIKALVTKSANDVAVVVAEAIAGDEERFAAMMTRKARAIGMRRTTFRNASGLPDPDQWTTARDLVTLGRAIHDRFPRYYPYFGTRSFTYEGRAYRNHNRLLGTVEGVDGIKTGYTRASGFNLLTSAKMDGRHILTVVLGGRSGRARDQQVAALIDEHMDRAHAGRRMTSTAVAALAREADDEDESGADQPAPRAPAAAPARGLAARPAGAPLPPLPTASMVEPAPLPAARPRPAVIAETGTRAPAEVEGLTRARPLALAASGSTNIVQSATTPLAVVGTTPRSPALRWVAGPQGGERPGGSAEPRLVPPGNVRYTNSVAAPASPADETQPLPQTAAPQPATPQPVTPQAPAQPVAKAEIRLPPPGQRGEAAAPALPAPAPRANLEPARPDEAPKPARDAARPAQPAPQPARSGWIIQLAATDSDAKARSILASAVEKTGRLLKSAEPFTEAVEKGGATLYRARFAGFDAEDAQAACKALKRSGFQCIAQKI
ncbi:serine hydrolase [Rhabdaerophilum calidifontis]|uniref:serine hydrolase n=1 Tax=Rhabdaerophilum calidifontis TaxID=2604328 RepID=UPI00123BFE57|nr:serine hydrolase [Rhabdaerophilum calidifontis]